jgi:SCP-2 sterol transfer family
VRDDVTFLSEAWLSAVTDALGTLGPTERTLVVSELIAGTPEDLLSAVTLVGDADGVRLVAGSRDDAAAWLTVHYADASALHDGTLDPAQALTEGRVKVRGDLRQVVEATELLARAHAVLVAR